jgi:type II secretory pathway component PulK
MEMNKYLTRNRKGSALLIALVVLVILTIMSTVFIERLLSFSKSSEGIENSNMAYYNALGSIETALFTG